VTRSFLSVAEDRERRARGVTVEQWIDAPAPPATRGECENLPRPCPALRCRYHIGLRGDGTFTCGLDFAELPEDERTFVRIGSVIGRLSRQRGEQMVNAALAAFRRAELEREGIGPVEESEDVTP